MVPIDPIAKDYINPFHNSTKQWGCSLCGWRYAKLHNLIVRYMWRMHVSKVMPLALKKIVWPLKLWDIPGFICLHLISMFNFRECFFNGKHRHAPVMTRSWEGSPTGSRSPTEHQPIVHAVDESQRYRDFAMNAVTQQTCEEGVEASWFFVAGCFFAWLLFAFTRGSKKPCNIYSWFNHANWVPSRV